MEARRNKSDGSALFNEFAGGAVLQIVRDRQLVAHGAAADPDEDREAFAMLDSYCLVRVSDAVLRRGGESASPALVRLQAQLRGKSCAGESNRGLR